MKFRALVICLIIFIIVGVIVYSAFKNWPVPIAENITLIIEDITPTGATAILTDLSGKDNLYNECYSVEKYEDGKWKNIAEESNTCHLIGIHLNDNNQVIFNLDWTDRYGALEAGKYRIVKILNGEYIYGEFTIK